MHSDVEEQSLTPGEREVASEHWDAIMFAPSRTTLEAARLALMEAPFSIQHAVIANITANWLEEYEPEREENPFLPPIFSQVLIPEMEETNSTHDLLWQSGMFFTESPSTYTVPSYSLPSPPESSYSLTSYAQRFVQGISHLHLPKLSGRMAPHNPSL